MSSKNSVKLIGRVAREIAISGDDKSKVARTSVAVTRNYKNADGNYESDFISIVAFGKQAEFLDKFFHKGKPIIVDGSIRTGSYTNKDGQKIYTTDVAVESIDFCLSDNSNDNSSDNTEDRTETKATEKSKAKKEEKKVNPDDDFMNIEPGEIEDLPW